MIEINLLKPQKKKPRESAPVQPSEKKSIKLKARPGLIYLFIIISAGAFYWKQQFTFADERALLQSFEDEKQKLQNVLAITDQLEKQKSIFQKKIASVWFMRI